MDYFGVEQYLVTDVTVKAVARQQVDRTTEYSGQFVTHFLQRHESDPRIRGEINQNVDIAVMTEVTPDRRAENGKLAHGMGTTEVAYCSLGDGHLRIHMAGRAKVACLISTSECAE
jgi:hypothetical protein